MKKIWSALKWLAAAVTAVVALLYIRSSDKHREKQSTLAHKAKEIERDKNKTIHEAMAARKKAQAAKLRAEAAHREGEARIHELEESNHTLAERVRAYNQRRAERMRNGGGPGV